MLSALLPDNSGDSETLPLSGTGWHIAPAHLHDEQRLVRALRELYARGNPIHLPDDFLNRRKQRFIQNSKSRIEADELQEQAEVIFDQLPQPHLLTIVTGPPGAAKTTVTAAWANLAREIMPDQTFLLITRERTALHRLQEKMNLTQVTALTTQEALDTEIVFPDYTCVILDEASLCCTREMAVLLEKAVAAKARRVILIGDDKQLFPQEVGQPFRWLRENGKGQVVTLRSSFRQKTPELRAMVQALHSGDVAAALPLMHVTFLPAGEVLKSLRHYLADRAPERLLVIVHGDDFLLERLRVLCPGFRIYPLVAAQGLAIDEVVFVIAGTLNLSELLVGCSRQRHCLDVFVNQAAYVDSAALRDGVGPYPASLMALDVIAEDALLALSD